MSREIIRPSRAYYWLAAGIAAAGLVSFAALLWRDLSGIDSSLVRFVLPGDAEISLKEPGEYQVFYEYRSTFGDRVYATGESLQGMRCTLREKTTGTRISLFAPSTQSSYTLGGSAGVSVLRFEIPRSGAYLFSGNYEESNRGPEVVFAVSHDFNRKLVSTILVSLLLFFGSLGIAALIFTVTMIRRRDAKARLGPILASQSPPSSPSISAP